MKLTFLHFWKSQDNASKSQAGITPFRLYPVLYLLPLGLIFELAGYMPPYLKLLLIYIFLGLPLCLRPSRRSVIGAIMLLGLMTIQACVALPPVAEVCLLVLAHQWIWAMAISVPGAIAVGLCFYTVLHFLLFLSPLGYPLIEAAARYGGRAAGWVTGSAFNLGPTYLNIGGLLLFLCLSVFGWDRTKASKVRTGCLLLVVFLSSGLFSVILLRKVDFGADFVWQLKYRDIFGYSQLMTKLRGLALLAYPALLYLVWLAAYLVLHYEQWRAEPAPAVKPSRGWSMGRFLFRDNAWQAGVIFASAVALLAIFPPTTWRRPGTCDLIFVERGVVSFTKPDYVRFGRAAGGMFGLLPDYAGLFGCKSAVVRDVPESLDTNQVLVLTNLDEPMPPDVFKRIWAFVEAGGKLWVMGDHTFIKNGRNHINDLLAPCHISLNHDSAQFFPQGWFHSYQFLQGTPFGSLHDLAENRPAILVGASLDVKRPAQPFILGRFGYSDWGPTSDPDNRGYIGDFKYQPNERLGDLVLLAGEKFGKGKVLVFGDTTSFFNNNLSRSYEILRCVLSWFGESSAWQSFASGPALLISLLCLGAAGFVMFLRRSIATLTSTLLACLVLSCAGHRSTNLLSLNIQTAQRHLAVLDFAHEPYTSKHSSMDSGLHGVSINLTRYGMLPVAINQWDPQIIEAARLIVLNAPRRPFTRSERRDLTRFMERGGTVWLGCGYPHSAFCKSLLDPLGLRLLGIPLGRFFDRTAFGQRISFVSAWPIEIENTEASVICFYDQWPLITLVPVGKGKLVLIGDSEFLHNRNVEGFETYDPATIQFIRSLLDYTVGGRGS